MTLDGELDLDGRRELLDAVDEAARDARLVVVDLDGVRFVDLQGLRALGAANRRAVDAGRRLALVNPSPAVDRLTEYVAAVGAWAPTDPRDVVRPRRAHRWSDAISAAEAMQHIAAGGGTLDGACRRPWPYV